jgi:hypothetical protein
MAAKTASGVQKPTRSLRFPAFITLGLSVTACGRTSSQSGCGGVVYAAVIDGLERHLDPLPLSAPGLATAVSAGRWVAVVRPWGDPIAHRAGPGHWWVLGVGESFRPTLLVEHRCGSPPLEPDVDLAVALLSRFLPVEDRPRDPNEPPPF